MAQVTLAVAATWVLLTTTTHVLADFHPNRDGSLYKFDGNCGELNFWSNDSTDECKSRIFVGRENGRSSVSFIWADDYSLEFKGAANWKVDRYGDRVLQLSAFRQHGPGTPYELDGFGHCRLIGSDMSRPDRMSCKLDSSDRMSISAEFKIVGEAERLR